MKKVGAIHDRPYDLFTSTRTRRREHSSRFKAMFYVIGFVIQSRVLLRTAPANRTKGMVEQFGIFGVPNPCRADPTFLNMVEHYIQLFMYVWIYFPRHHYTRTDGFLSTL